jgi:hypothetical protein
MQSISFRTANEIINNNAIEILDEIETLYERIPVERANDMVQKLKSSVNSLPDYIEYDAEKMKSPSDKTNNDLAYQPYYEPRQHTPNGLTKIANQCGFDSVSYHGVHPHLIDPNINKLLPPKVFNQISSCLNVLEDLPVSLTWSSVFIGAFELKE